MWHIRSSPTLSEFVAKTTQQFNNHSTIMKSSALADVTYPLTLKAFLTVTPLISVTNCSQVAHHSLYDQSPNPEVDIPRTPKRSANNFLTYASKKSLTKQLPSILFESGVKY